MADESQPASTPDPNSQSQSSAKSASNNSETATDTENFAGHFVHSLGHAVIQGPIDGVREIVNTITSKDCVPKVQLVEPPKKAEFGTPAWQGQQLGKGAGTFAMLILMGRFFRVRL